MSEDQSKTIRIKQELLKAGFSRYGLLKGEARHLPEILHADEHIGGAIYGRYAKTNGSAMMIATDRRLIFLDHKLLFSSNEEISYDFVSGITCNARGSYATVTTHTRLGDFTLRYVNKSTADIFVQFIEKKRIEQTHHEEPKPTKNSAATNTTTLTPEARNYLMSRNMGVLSTYDGVGNLSGAAVHYAFSPEGLMYIVTKEATEKVKNIAKHPQVAFTVYDVSTMQTLQLQGRAEIEKDVVKAHETISKLMKPRMYGKQASWPPLTKLVAGGYVVIVIMPSSIKFFDYSR